MNAAKDRCLCNVTDRDVCCCNRLKTVRQRAPGTWMGGKHLYHSFDYQPLKVCVCRLLSVLDDEKKFPCVCAANKPPILSRAEARELKHKERCQKEEEKNKLKELTTKQLAEGRCLSPEEKQVRFVAEAHELCPQETTPCSSSLNTSASGKVVKIVKDPLDCPCRRHLTNEEAELLKKKDCKELLCTGPRAMQEPSEASPKLLCVLPDLCKVPKQRRDNRIKEGKWDDPPPCQWNSADKTSPYWEQEEISQVAVAKDLVYPIIIILYYNYFI